MNWLKEHLQRQTDSREPCVSPGTHSKLLKSGQGQEGRQMGLFPDGSQADILLLLALWYLYFKGSRIGSSYEPSGMKLKKRQEWNKEIRTKRGRQSIF